MKRPENRGGSVCIMCGKPSQQQICEACKIKVEAAAIRHKLEVDKSDKRPN